MQTEQRTTEPDLIGQINAELASGFDHDAEMDKIVQWTTEAWEVFDKVYPTLKMHHLGTVIKWENKLKVTMGIARYVIKTGESSIKYSPSIWAMATEADKRETVFHELAHIAASKHYNKNCGHKWQWRKMMKDIGYPGAKRCHSYKIARKEFYFQCGCPEPVKVGIRHRNMIHRGFTICCLRCRHVLQKEVKVIK